MRRRHCDEIRNLAKIFAKFEFPTIIFLASPVYLNVKKNKTSTTNLILLCKRREEYKHEVN